MASVQLTGTHREIGSQPTRAAGAVPAVLYGHGIKTESIAVPSQDFGKVFAQAGYTTLVTLKVEKRDHNVLIREVQWHPLKDQVLHVDFYQVRLDEKVRAKVPLKFTGESAAVKDQGGVLVRSLDALDVEAFPQDLPHDIEVDISALKDFEVTIHVKDLKLPSGVTLFHEQEDVVAVAQPPRSEQELEALSEEATEDVAAVEVVKDEKKADEEAEAGAEAAPVADGAPTAPNEKKTSNTTPT